MEHLTKKKPYLFVIIFFCAFSSITFGQNYKAIQGSSFAGSLGVGNNPASIINTPFPWDVDLFSLQITNATNVFTVNKFSLLSSPKKASFSIDAGDYKRRDDFNFNVNLLNTRVALGKKRAIALGINLRGYGNVYSDAYNYNDSLVNIRQFLNVNNPSVPYNGHFTTSSWMEIFLTYSQTIMENETGRLNGGITLKVNRGISGAFGQLQNGLVSFHNDGATSYYTITGANANYGYSFNYDDISGNKSNSQNVKDFIKDTRGSFSVDLGAEYIITPQSTGIYGDDNDYFEYDWKIGVALLNLGRNQYKYGSQSRAIAQPKTNVPDSVLDSKFDFIESFAGFNDSLSTVVNSFNTLDGKFHIRDPARLVINVDRPLQNDFYINADLSLNLAKLLAGKNLYVHEINLITVTPRWETRRWGVYLPVQYNTDNKFWVGLAFKAGPLLLGLHNLAYLFSKSSLQNGGGYLALIIRPSKKTSGKKEKILECPKL
ncbi:MAG: hypothetical protein JST96_04790 [Bacteroidetes bacterium]|nr:hypothetical protein [Bacteroidota bacterium]